MLVNCTGCGYTAVGTLARTDGEDVARCTECNAKVIAGDLVTDADALTERERVAFGLPTDDGDGDDTDDVLVESDSEAA